MLSSKSSEQSIPWGLLAIEAMLIVLSVLLALGVNSWREERANEEQVRIALQSVVDEAEKNCRRVGDLLPYHRRVFVGEEEYEGLGIALLGNDAWTSAQTTGAAHHMDYDVASAAGAVHALQFDHRRLVDAGIQAVYNASTSQDPYQTKFPPEEGENWLRGPHPIMLADLIRIQSDLLAQYRTLFAMSEERYGIEARADCARPEAGDATTGEV